MYLPFKRKFVDFHGVVPEEFLYQQDFENAKSFGAIENLAVNKADFLIVVTEAMRKHFIQKYGKVINGQFITLPILPEFTTSNKQSISSKREDKPIIIYAGGLQKWQQVQKMVDVIRQTADNYHYKFFCPDPEKIKTFLTEDFIKSHDIEIDDISHNDLIKEYEKSDYGLILREDIVINQVACPTKLVEYLASGVVPIMDYSHIGDFKSLGMKYIKLQDLKNNQLTDEITQLKFAKENYKVIASLKKLQSEGLSKLKQAIKSGS
jgi:glycosyltransferase involved in cell wall biosynthesis